MGFKLGKKSLEKLNGVHPDLVKVVKRAIELTEIDFSVGEGLRTLEKQKEYLAKGATTTLKSRHLTGHAVDLFAFVGKEVRWDARLYHKIKDAMFAAGKEFGVPIRWGGDWDCDGDSGDEKFFDGPHFELPRSTRYP